MASDDRVPAELRVEEWLRRAHDDELNAASLLKHRDGAPSGACFLAHQMAEKYLKAYLIAKQNRFPKIHLERNNGIPEIRRSVSDVEQTGNAGGR